MTEQLPKILNTLIDDQPELWAAYQAMGQACADAGPMDEKTRRLVKLALAIGARSEGAVHSHARRGLQEGISPEEIRQTAVLAITTLGFPAAMAALSWIRDVTQDDGS